MQSSHVISFHLWSCLWAFSLSKQSCSCNLGTHASGFQFFSCQTYFGVQVTLFNGDSPFVTWWNKVCCFHKSKASSKQHLLFLTFPGDVEVASNQAGYWTRVQTCRVLLKLFYFSVLWKQSCLSSVTLHAYKIRDEFHFKTNYYGCLILGDISTSKTNESSWALQCEPRRLASNCVSGINVGYPPLLGRGQLIHNTALPIELAVMSNGKPTLGNQVKKLLPSGIGGGRTSWKTGQFGSSFLTSDLPVGVVVFEQDGLGMAKSPHPFLYVGNL